MKLFDDYTKWEVLETYNVEGTEFCVQVRMNKRTHFKEFKVNKICGYGYYNKITPEQINNATKEG